MVALGALPPEEMQVLSGNLRALRDAFKYSFTLVLATRRPLDAASELAELFFANTLWLGALDPEDARWSASSYARRAGLDWDKETLDALAAISPPPTTCGGLAWQTTRCWASLRKGR